jgi:hypothetical protein
LALDIHEWSNHDLAFYPWERILELFEEDSWVCTSTAMENRSVALAEIIIYNRINEVKHVSLIFMVFYICSSFKTPYTGRFTCMLTT